MSSTTRVSTFCRICEPLCPLVAEVDESQEVVAIHPDHHDPNRLDHPLRRTNPKSEAVGRFERVSWDDALGEVGERLRSIRAEHGTEAVGCYWGNPLAYTSSGIATVYGFWAKMQS